MIKALIFDFDGTIGDTLPLVIKAIRDSVQPYLNRELSDDEIAATFGPIEEGSVKYFLPDATPSEFEAACQAMFKSYRENHKTLCPKPFDGVAKLISHLKNEGFIVTLATGKGKTTCDISLEQYGMDNLFDMVKTGSMKGGIKPQMMREILQEYKLRPQEAVYIGDAPTDVDAARIVGVGIVSVLYGTRIEEAAVKAKHPDAICYTIDELQTYLDSLNK